MPFFTCSGLVGANAINAVSTVCSLCLAITDVALPSSVIVKASLGVFAGSFALTGNCLINIAVIRCDISMAGAIFGANSCAGFACGDLLSAAFCCEVVAVVD